MIPYHSTTCDKPKFFPRKLYKGRARIEQTMGKLKRFKRVALRFKKTASITAPSSLSQRASFLLESVHTA